MGLQACGGSAWLIFFFFNDTATTEIYTLSLHDALPISGGARSPALASRVGRRPWSRQEGSRGCVGRSEEHTSELQPRLHLVCRLLLEKKKHLATCVATEPSARMCSQLCAYASTPASHSA